MNYDPLFHNTNILTFLEILIILANNAKKNGAV